MRATTLVPPERVRSTGSRALPTRMVSVSIDRSDALTELGDPATGAERLAEIAYAHPDLGAKIVAHPNVYPDLVEWLSQYGSVDAEPEADVADDDDAPPPPPEDDAPPPPPSDEEGAAPPPPPIDAAAASPRTGLSRRTVVIIAAAAAAVLALGGTAAALVSTGVIGGTAAASGQIACPDDSRAVMWSDWEGGATLVCEFADGGYTMIVGSDGSVRRSDEVTVTPAGFRSSIGEVAFGGWAVWPGESDGFLVTSWGDVEHGESSGTLGLADRIPPCPGESFAISLSVWDGGWLLICGTSDSEYSAFHFDADGVIGSGGALELIDGRFCGEITSTSGQVCVSTAPALVEIDDDSGVSRYTVASNYFPETGFGGSGQGTGAYGVEAPGESAEEQVGYLVAILEKSRAARSTVSGVLAPLNACSVSSADVQNLRNLHQARTDLLVALRSTPVDQVPDGDRLLAMLTEAISLSEQAIVGYIATGEQMAGGDCGNGRATYRNAIAIADQAEASKQRFVDAWNAQIVPQFGVAAFTARDI